MKKKWRYINLIIIGLEGIASNVLETGKILVD